MMENLELYEKFRVVPEEAKKTIDGGRLKGMTDINPMWRIKMLTDAFGPVGFGWYYEITDQWIVPGDVESAAFVNIKLFVKCSGEWSVPIVGTGGSKFISKEKSSVYTDDECYKKALTDAISVACKALGMGADVYWGSDRTKYTQLPEDKTSGKAKSKMSDKTQTGKKLISRAYVVALEKMCDKKKVDPATICRLYKVDNLSQLTECMYKNINEHWKEIIEAQRT